MNRATISLKTLYGQPHFLAFMVPGSFLAAIVLVLVVVLVLLAVFLLDWKGTGSSKELFFEAEQRHGMVAPDSLEGIVQKRLSGADAFFVLAVSGKGDFLLRVCSELATSKATLNGRLTCDALSALENEPVRIEGQSHEAPAELSNGKPTARLVIYRVWISETRFSVVFEDQTEFVNPLHFRGVVEENGTGKEAGSGILYYSLKPIPESETQGRERLLLNFYDLNSGSAVPNAGLARETVSGLVGKTVLVEGSITGISDEAVSEQTGFRYGIAAKKIWVDREEIAEGHKVVFSGFFVEERWLDKGMPSEINYFVLVKRPYDTVTGAELKSVYYLLNSFKRGQEKGIPNESLDKNDLSMLARINMRLHAEGELIPNPDRAVLERNPDVILAMQVKKIRPVE